MLKAAGKRCLPMSADVDVKQLKGRLLKMLEVWAPTMKSLQGEVPVGEPLDLKDEDCRAEGTSHTALEDMSIYSVFVLFYFYTSLYILISNLYLLLIWL